MIGSQEQWVELRTFKALADAGATWAEIAGRPATTGAPSSATWRPTRRPRRRRQPSGDQADARPTRIST
jgi:hypothetical protein